MKQYKGHYRDSEGLCKPGTLLMSDDLKNKTEDACCPPSPQAHQVCTEWQTCELCSQDQAVCIVADKQLCGGCRHETRTETSETGTP